MESPPTHGMLNYAWFWLTRMADCYWLSRALIYAPLVKFWQLSERVESWLFLIFLCIFWNFSIFTTFAPTLIIHQIQSFEIREDGGIHRTHHAKGQVFSKKCLTNMVDNLLTFPEAKHTPTSFYLNKKKFEGHFILWIKVFFSEYLIFWLCTETGVTH